MSYYGAGVQKWSTGHGRFRRVSVIRTPNSYFVTTHRPMWHRHSCLMPLMNAYRQEWWGGRPRPRPAPWPACRVRHGVATGGEKRVQGDPRGPGGPPHQPFRNRSFLKSMWRGHSCLPCRDSSRHSAGCGTEASQKRPHEWGRGRHECLRHERVARRLHNPARRKSIWRA